LKVKERSLSNRNLKSDTFDPII